jgi:uncharacterized protein YdeI (YjbR/CyaY-like superfamily)
MPEVTTGTVHKIPNDLKTALLSDAPLLAKWNGLTPLARNEWICWTISVKKEETRLDHLKRLKSEIKQGKRRPCCWIGCIHRPDKPLSPSVKGILGL